MLSARKLTNVPRACLVRALAGARRPQAQASIACPARQFNVRPACAMARHVPVALRKAAAAATAHACSCRPRAVQPRPTLYCARLMHAAGRARASRRSAHMRMPRAHPTVPPARAGDRHATHTQNLIHTSEIYLTTQRLQGKPCMH